MLLEVFEYACQRIYRIGAATFVGTDAYIGQVVLNSGPY